MAQKTEKNKTQKSHLTKKEIDAFQKILFDMRAEVLSKLKGSAEHVKDHASRKSYSQHQAETGSDDFDREVFIELNHQETGILQKIERALEKIDEGSYGICDFTQRPIPKARLDAMPYACLTVEAQQEFEERK